MVEELVEEVAVRFLLATVLEPFAATGQYRRLRGGARAHDTFSLS